MVNYLLISSAYRDRLLYPNPAEFIIPFGTINNVNQNTFNVFTTTNPVTNSFPEFNACWTNFFSQEEGSFKTNIISGIDNKIIIDKNVNSDLLGISREPLPDEIISFRQKLENCYDVLRGFWLKLRIEGKTYYRLIIGYEPTTRTILLRNPFPFLNFENCPIACEIINTFRSSPTSLIDGKFISINGDFLRNSPLIYFDNNIFLYDVNQNEFRKTSQYIEEFHKYELEETFITDGRLTNQFMLFGNVISSYRGKILLQKNLNFYHFLPSSVLWYSRGMGYRSNMKVKLVNVNELSIDENTLPNYFCIFEIKNVSYIGEILDSELSIHSIGKQEFSLRTDYKVIPIENNQSFQPANLQIGSFSLGFEIQFKGDVPNIHNLLGNYFFPLIMSQQYLLDQNHIYFQPNGTITPRNTLNKVTDLSSSQSENGVVGIKGFTKLENNIYLIQTQQFKNIEKFKLLSKAFLESNIPSYCGGIDNFLILNFSSEGVIPLNYTGSQITQSQMSCYELGVSSLILPNLILQTTTGLLTSSYPYLFVEISNETLPSGGNTDIIYSNNPNATKNTFICPTLDVNNPETTKFIKIASAGSQIMKFSPYDNLRVRISLPNGQTFTTEVTDYLVPHEPNPRIQITLFLSITRLN